VTAALAIDDDLSEPEAIRRAKHGDIRAFETLYRIHGPRVYAVALRLTGNANAASEATQDAFVRAWERLNTFRGESSFGTWLHRLTVNATLATRRSESRRLRRVEPRDPGTLALHGGREDDPAARMDLEAAIRALPAASRTVFVLHDVEGYDYEEIAELTGRAVSSVRSQISRARDRLRELLEA